MKRHRQTILFIVNDNIKKEQAYFGSRSEQLRRIAHGVYISQDASFKDVFQVYGLRLARKFFPNAALTHSTAWYRRPLHDRVFVGGDYPYKKSIDVDGYEGRIVQSTVHPDYSDARLYQEAKITDPIGSFQMWCATPELILLQQMDATKVNPEKHLPDPDVRAIWREVKARHGGRGHAWDVMEEVAKAAGKENEAERFFKKHYRDYREDD